MCGRDEERRGRCGVYVGMKRGEGGTVCTHIVTKREGGSEVL